MHVLVQTTVATWLPPPPEVHSEAFEAALFSTFQSGLNIHNMYIEQYLQLERPSISIRQNVGANTQLIPVDFDNTVSQYIIIIEQLMCAVDDELQWQLKYLA